jgi:hypothetical protein
MSGQTAIIKEPLPNPDRKRGGCHRRVGFFMNYAQATGHDITAVIELEVFALLLAGLVQAPNPTLALFVPQLSLMLTAWV